MAKWSSAAIACSLVLLILFAVGSRSAPDVVSLIQQGNQAFDQRFSISASQPDDFFTAYLPFLRQAIDAYQQAVPLLGNLPVQSQAYVYNRLSQLDFELNKLLTDQSEIEKTLLSGKDAALSSMKLHAGFDEQNVTATVRFVDDAAPLEW